MTNTKYSQKLTDVPSLAVAFSACVPASDTFTDTITLSILSHVTLTSES